MMISGNEYQEIQITTESGELIASITDVDVIKMAGYKVVCIPIDG